MTFYENLGLKIWKGIFQNCLFNSRTILLDGQFSKKALELRLKQNWSRFSKTLLFEAKHAMAVLLKQVIHFVFHAW